MFEKLSWKQALGYIVGAAMYGVLLWLLDKYFDLPLPSDSVLSWYLPYILFVLSLMLLQPIRWFLSHPALHYLVAAILALSVEVTLVPLWRFFNS